MFSGLGLATGHGADSSNDLDQLLAFSEQYAIDKDGCALLDGYHCSEDHEEVFVSVEAQANLLSGNLLKAWQAAAADFVNHADQTPEQVDLKHYKIGFGETENNYVILFQGLLLPIVSTEEGEQKIVGMLRTSFGRTTKYWIAKSDFSIENKLFYK